MSYEQLATSVNELAVSNQTLVAAALATQEVSNDNALVAQHAAETAGAARDSVLLSAGIFGTTALGLIATSNGEYFSVPSGDLTASMILYRNDSGAPTELSRSPSTVAVVDSKITSGPLIFTTAGSALNGATAINESGKYVGFNIPVGQTGASSYITTVVPFDQTFLTRLIGSEIEITTQYEASAGFLAAVPLTPKIRVGRAASYVDLTPTSSKLEQVGTTITLRMRYTVTAADQYLHVIYQANINQPVAVATRSLKVTTVSYVMTDLLGDVTTSNDFMLDQRLALLSAAVANAQANVDSSMLSTGNLYSSMTLSGEALGGASFIPSSDGRTVGGLRIPAGTAGTNAYQTVMRPISALVGYKLKFKVVYNATTDFLTETTISSAALRVSRTVGGTVGIVPTDLSRTQVGTVVTVTFSYTVLAGDLTVGTLLQVTPSSPVIQHERTVELSSFSYFIVASPSGGVSGADLIIAQLLTDQKATSLVDAKAAIAAASLTSGELVAGSVTTGQVFNGGAFITSNGVTQGLSFPIGATGGNSFIGTLMPFSPATLAQLVGATLRITMSYDTTANFFAETPRSSVTLQVIRAGVTVNVTPASVTTKQVGTILTSVLTYVVTATDAQIKPVYQVSLSAVAQDHARTMTVKSVTYSLDALAAGVSDSTADLMLSAKLQTIKDLIPSASITQIKVGPTGIYATPKLAMAAIVDASAAKQYELLIDTSVIYDQDANWSVKDYVHMTADGPGYAWIHYENPDNVDPTIIPLTQTFWDNRTSILTRLKVTGRNVRYPIHSDSGGVDTGRIQTLRQCWIEHYGNQGAQAYQDSISSGVTVWASTHAWGCGTSSAMLIDSRDTVFRSPSTAFYFHTRQLFTKGSRQTLTNCRMLTTNDSGEAIAIQPLGSLQEDVLQVNGCELDGFMSYVASPWIPDTLVNQPANHSEVKVIGSDNTPFAFKITDFGRALKIESNDTTAISKIEVSGDAVPIVFGRQVYSMPGVVGIKGYVYGWADISGTGVGLLRNVFITSLGQRLGDCTTLNKTLSVKINGGATVTHVFNQNYTAQTNTTILAAINATLGSAAVATAYDIGGRYRPEMLDEERSLKNNSAEGILMGMVLAWDGHNKKIRKMTATDAPSLFAGIAMEDIYPGSWGRVKTCGWVLNTDLYQFTGAPTYHQVFYVDAAVPGKPTLTVGTNAIMRGKATNVVEVAPK